MAQRENPFAKFSDRDQLNEINDHTPTFQYASYTFYTYNDSVVGLVLGSISATDADIGTNGQFVYNVNRTGSSHKYFNVSSNGQLKLQKSLNGITERTKLEFTVYATDAGSPTRTGFTTVTVIVLERSAATVSTTTIVYRSFIQDERNIVCITFVSLLALSTTLLTVWICWTTNSTWPAGFDPFEECIRNCRCPTRGRDYRNGNGKGSNSSRPVFNRSRHWHPEMPKNQTPTHQPQPEKPKNRPSLTSQMAANIVQSKRPSRACSSMYSPKRPEKSRFYSTLRQGFYSFTDKT
ncbi:hypothetical protein CHS0354_013744 [Potamilus streckersoni]|uniref:Cadherin domain-containing protein n=1 Tax=Potamilus streckersoni TaxID=2493646 RepID=A0AAE0SHL9_9BIVA|nr:hypothetical protein CHS0354_013744 [Potamilus streckersoni]